MSTIRYSPEVKAEAVRLYVSGMEGPEVCKRLHIGGRARLYVWVRELGYIVRRGGVKKRISKQDSSRNSWLRCHYGITNDDYNRMFAEQEGKCKLCGRHQSEFKYRLGVDHNHQTQEVRGLLCKRCNVMVSVVEDFNIKGQTIDQYLER